jgi:hypothetical protein
MVKEITPDHDPASYDAAWKLLNQSDRFPIGTIFREQKRTLEERVNVSAGPRLDLKNILASFR